MPRIRRSTDRPGSGWLAGPASGVLLLLSGLALAPALAPLLQENRDALATLSGPVARMLAPFETLPPADEQPMALVRAGLFERLAEGDRARLPTVEVLPGGTIRYRYRRRQGEPELTVPEIRALLRDPPRHTEERAAIRRLLAVLQRARVRLVLEAPRKRGAAAEWDHAARTVRIQPEVLARGTVDFAEVLNHEALHVAQSCASGGLRSPPRLLGLAAVPVDPHLAEQLEEPLYADAGPGERRLEREAYAHQRDLALGADLVATYCPLAA
ncbi:MAG: hypothetical protein VKI81_03680 [Synechococcaceae cyanobacterium]|nr:hypothetical protein [Synechococcaceae cyanobacterium]